MDHDLLTPISESLTSNLEVIYSNPENIPLKIAEAVAIEHPKPLINVKHSALYDFLSLYKENCKITCPLF